MLEFKTRSMTSILDKIEYNQSMSFTPDHSLNYTKQQGVSSENITYKHLIFPMESWAELKSQAGAPTFVYSTTEDKLCSWLYSTTELRLLVRFISH